MQELLRAIAARAESWTAGQIVLNLSVAFLLGVFVTAIYRATHRQMVVSFSFVNTLIVVCMVMSMVMMIIGDSIARAFGLAGAMSIIRFRTVVKDTRDTAFVFYALGAGMAAGTGNLWIAFIGTPLVGLFLGILHWTGHGTTAHEAYLLHFEIDVGTGLAGEPWLALFRRRLESWNLVSGRSVRSGIGIHYAYQVRLRPGVQTGELIHELGSLEGVMRVQLALGEEPEP